MTRRFERKSYDPKTGNFEHLYTYIIAVYPHDDTVITVTRDGQHKTVKVVNSYEYAYKLQKGQIKAKGGATGLYNFIDDCLSEGFGEVMAYKVLDHIIDNMKEA